VTHGRYVTFQMAEIAIPRNLFADILRLIAELRPPPDPLPTIVCGTLGSKSATKISRASTVRLMRRLFKPIIFLLKRNETSRIKSGNPSQNGQIEPVWGCNPPSELQHQTIFLPVAGLQAAAGGRGAAARSILAAAILLM
jgi:hypothetical protein